MPSSRFTASTPSPPPGAENSRRSPLYTLPTVGNLRQTLSSDTSRNMEELLRNIYGDLPHERGSGKSVEEVWSDISGSQRGESGVGFDGSGNGEMTLEDFLERGSPPREEDGRVPSVAEPLVVAPHAVVVESPGNLGFGNGTEAGVVVSGGTGRGRKRPQMDPVDRAALQRQKRMIKNRESAARSRERKQAYIAELEQMVAQLEEENAQLLQHQEEERQKRLKQLMEATFPDIRKKSREETHRRSHSLEW